jgi:hypothetical protein
MLAIAEMAVISRLQQRPNKQIIFMVAVYHSI